MDRFARYQFSEHTEILLRDLSDYYASTLTLLDGYFVLSSEWPQIFSGGNLFLFNEKKPLHRDDITSDMSLIFITKDYPVVTVRIYYTDGTMILKELQGNKCVKTVISKASVDDVKRPRKITVLEDVKTGDKRYLEIKNTDQVKFRIQLWFLLENKIARLKRYLSKETDAKRKQLIERHLKYTEKRLEVYQEVLVAE